MTVIDFVEFEKAFTIKEEQRGTFHDKLFEIIDEKGFSNKEVYTRCNIERKRFSKIQCTHDVKPSKRVILALCVGLELTPVDAIDLMGRADKAFNPNDPRDQYVLGFLEKRYGDIWKVNEFLAEKGLEVIGCQGDV